MRETHLEDGKWWVSPFNFEVHCARWIEPT